MIRNGQNKRNLRNMQNIEKNKKKHVTIFTYFLHGPIGSYWFHNKGSPIPNRFPTIVLELRRRGGRQGQGLICGGTSRLPAVRFWVVLGVVVLNCFNHF